MVKKAFFSLAVFSLMFLAAAAIKVKASGNVSGWLWGGGTEVDGDISPEDGTNTNLGWISMNSANCDADDDDASDGAGACPAMGTAIPDYGVTIPASGGNVSGYAWSENLGWVSFTAADLTGCPSAPCTARKSGNNLHGWARIMSIPQAGANAGGWEGWIKTHSVAGDPITYGVTIDDSDGTFCKAGDPTTDASGHCYAWSDELGWIDFSRASIGPSNNPPSVKALPDGGMATINTNAGINCGSTSDPEGDPLTYQWTQVGGPAVTINNSNQCNASFTVGSIVGVNYVFNLSVSDGINPPVSDQADITSVAVPCLCNTGCEVNTCTGTNCNDSCGNPVCPGTKDCSSSGPNWREVAP